MNDFYDLESQEGSGPVGQMVRASRIGAKNFRDVNLLLTEALFFYRRDNRFLFNLLRENQAFFKEFWQRCHGQELVIDANVAYRRLPVDGIDADTGFRNTNVRMAGRALFAWTGRGQGERSIVFMLFLRYYEEVLRRQEANEDGERRFFYHEFFNYARSAFDEFYRQAGKPPPKESAIFQACEKVFEEMARFRFIEHDDQTEIAAQDDRANLGTGYAKSVVIVYRALDGLRAYDPNTLTQELFDRTFNLKAANPEAETDSSEDAGVDVSPRPNEEEAD